MEQKKLYLYTAYLAAGLVLLMYLGLLAAPNPADKASQAHGDVLMQISGYVQLTLLAALELFDPLKKKLALKLTAVQLNLTHAGLGLSFVLINFVHISGLPSGYLAVLHALIYLAVLSGAGLLLLKHTIRPAVRQAMLYVHIALSFVVLSAALVHIYFVYMYTTNI